MVFTKETTSTLERKIVARVLNLNQNQWQDYWRKPKMGALGFDIEYRNSSNHNNMFLLFQVARVVGTQGRGTQKADVIITQKHEAKKLALSIDMVPLGSLENAIKWHKRCSMAQRSSYSYLPRCLHSGLSPLTNTW